MPFIIHVTLHLALASILIALGSAAPVGEPDPLKQEAKRLVGGELAVTSELLPGGAGITSLVDLASGRDLAAPDPDPLFTVTLRHTTSGKTLEIDADSKWKKVHQSASPNELLLNWSEAEDPRLAGLEVVVTCRPIAPTPAVAEAAPGGLAWRIHVNNGCPGWAVWQVVFPRLALRPMGEKTRVLIPDGCGVLWSDLGKEARTFKGAYPGGWATMQFLAAYDEVARSGLYIAHPDPAAAMKKIIARTDPERQRLNFSWTHSPPGMTTAGLDFNLEAPVEWRPLRGDWFDAAMIYRDWVRRDANWFPKLGPDGREDTPMWLRELCVWSQIKGSPAKVEPQARAFVEAMDLPSGFLWYRWHQIPFDNDYPHYLPAREGFPETVERIQKHSAKPAYVMPYINGRLWDTRDRGVTDFQFSSLAKPAAIKDIDGKALGETYRSKETDGSPVRLAPMCPSTPLWQKTMQDLVLQLMKENGVRAVYADQVAAARPRLCFDPDHKHPAGGGSWWVDSYRQMFTDLRRQLPAGHALTTECNAEPYLDFFDAYLTWHWQDDGQVPAFPAVYGGAIQMFGRAYRGGPATGLRRTTRLDLSQGRRRSRKRGLSAADGPPASPLAALLLRRANEPTAQVAGNHPDRDRRLAMGWSHPGHHRRGSHRSLGVAGAGCWRGSARAQARADFCQRLRPARCGPLHLRCRRIRTACGWPQYDDRHRRERKRA